jgi:hypothetical protein
MKVFSQPTFLDALHNIPFDSFQVPPVCPSGMGSVQMKMSTENR